MIVGACGRTKLLTSRTRKQREERAGQVPTVLLEVMPSTTSGAQ
jgi:hypothetical protein